METDINRLFRYAHISPIKEYPSYVNYPTPFRPSHKPSFFVIDGGRRWIEEGMKDDVGTPVEIYGDIIQLLIALGAANTRTMAYELLERFPATESVDVISTALVNCVTPHILLAPVHNRDISSIQIIREHAIVDNKLLRRIRSSAIPLNLANRFLCQAEIKMGTFVETSDEVLLFKTGNGGSISFSPYEVMAIGREDVSVIKGFANSGRVSVFVSILDYLEFISRTGQNSSDAVIANNYRMLPRAIEVAKHYEWADYYLPNNNVTSEQIRMIENSSLDKCYKIWIQRD